MSRQELIAAAKAQVKAYNEKDWDAARNSLTPGIVYDEAATNRKAEGVEDVIELWQGWGRAFPDSKATFGEPIVEGDTVVLPVTWRGTHTGPLPTPDGEIAPTGKGIEIRACQIVRVEGERAASIVQYFDMMTMLTQLGVAPAAAAASAQG